MAATILWVSVISLVVFGSFLLVWTFFDPWTQKDNIRDNSRLSHLKTSIGGDAFNESFGFFQDSNEDWSLIKSIISSQRRTEDTPPVFVQSGAIYFQKHWEPEISCRFERRLGPKGDGGKWVCDPHRIKKNCLVYSIGCNNDWSFEEAIYKEIGCEIHTFDHTMSEVIGKPSFVNFHNIGVAPYNTSTENTQDLRSLMSKYSQGRVIDILKIDCEGCEFKGLTPLFKDATLNRSGLPKQILIEIHAGEERNRYSHDLLRAMTDAGYVIFHKEANIQGSGGSCTEFSLLLLNIPQGS